MKSQETMALTYMCTQWFFYMNHAGSWGYKMAYIHVAVFLDWFCIGNGERIFVKHLCCNIINNLMQNAGFNSIKDHKSHDEASRGFYKRTKKGMTDVNSAISSGEGLKVMAFLVQYIWPITYSWYGGVKGHSKVTILRLGQCLIQLQHKSAYYYSDFEAYRERRLFLVMIWNSLVVALIGSQHNTNTTEETCTMLDINLHLFFWWKHLWNVVKMSPNIKAVNHYIGVALPCHPEKFQY